MSLKKRIVVLMLLLGYSLPIFAIGGDYPFRSDKLKNMAEALGMENITSLPDGTHYDAFTYKGLPVTVIRHSSVFDHIGYSFFNASQREVLGAVVCNFLERYALEADLPLPREKTLDIQMLEDGVVVSGGSLKGLLCRCQDSSLLLTCHILGGKKYLLQLGESDYILFPVDPELLLGRTQRENDRRLPEEIQTASYSAPTVLPETSEVVMREDGLYVWEGSDYYLPSLNANRFFQKSDSGELIPVKDASFPSETVSNLLGGYFSGGDITVSMTMSVFGLKTIVFETTLRSLVHYAAANGCLSYWGAIGTSPSDIEGLWVMRNESVGYNHVIRVRFPMTAIENLRGAVEARLTPFVPTYSVKYLFEEINQ